MRTEASKPGINLIGHAGSLGPICCMYHCKFPMPWLGKIYKPCYSCTWDACKLTVRICGHTTFISNSTGIIRLCSVPVVAYLKTMQIGNGRRMS